MLVRKLMAASFASCLAVLVLPFHYWPTDMFGGPDARNLANYFANVHIYSLYVFPAVFTYGIGTSLLTEFLVVRYSLKPPALWMAVGHLVFGSVLFVFSLVPAALFLLFDWLIARLMPAHLRLLKWLAFIIPIAVLQLSTILRDAA